MSDAVSRDAVMQLLQEWTYCCDVEDAVRALPAVQPDALVEINQLDAEFDSEIFSHLSNKLLALIEKPKGTE